MTSEMEHALRSTSDQILATLEQLEKLEAEKRELEPGSDRFRALAVEIERLAAVIFAQSHVEQQLAERSREVTLATGTVLTPIEDMVPTREIPTILGEWRAAERALASSDPDTAEHALAAADVRRLRDEYQRAHEAQSDSQKLDSGS